MAYICQICVTARSLVVSVQSLEKGVAQR